MKNGLLQVYTGDGKGKTTAAFGMAFRAHGRGFKVGVVQFMKTRATGEVMLAQTLENFLIERSQKHPLRAKRCLARQRRQNRTICVNYQIVNSADQDSNVSSLLFNDTSAESAGVSLFLFAFGSLMFIHFLYTHFL